MLTDKEIQDTVFAVLRRWKDDRAWDRFTRESGAYDVTSLRAEVMEIIKAVLVADGAIDDASLELGRLLNHIHGDSGQYVAVQGWKKAATDALAKLTTPGVQGTFHCRKPAIGPACDMQCDRCAADGVQGTGGDHA